MSDKSTPAVLDKKILQKTKALFSFVKSKLTLSKHNDTPHSASSQSDKQSNSKSSKNSTNQTHNLLEDDFQMSIENVCNADQLEQLEKILNNRTEQRQIIISDELLSEISFMIVRMADFIQSTQDQRQLVVHQKEEIETLKKEKNELQIVVNGFNQSMNQYEKANKIEYEEMENRYLKEIEALNKQIEILIQEKNLQKKQSDEQIVQLIQTKEQLANLQSLNRSIQSSLDFMNIEMVKLKAIHQGEVSPYITEKNLKGVLTGKNTKHSILSFLSFKEILKMRLINREYNLIITRDFQLQRVIIGQISSNFNQKTRELQRRANFFQQISESLPDEVLKVSILKYLCQRHKVGDLLIPSLNSAQILIDGLLFRSDNDSSNHDNNRSTSQSSISTNSSIKTNNNYNNSNDVKQQQQQQYDGIDLLSECLSGDQDNIVKQQPQVNNIETNGNNNNSHQVQEQQNSETKEKSTANKTFSFMKKLFDKKGTSSTNNQSSQKDQQINQASRNALEKTIQNDFISEEYANKLLLDMNAKLQIDSRVLSLFKEEKEFTMQQLKFEQDDIHNKLKQLILKYTTDQKRFTHFLDTLQTSFCNMYVFSKFLYQECKALYDLQSYLSYELIQNKIKLEDSQNRLEDTLESKQSLEQMKDYLSSKLKETEKKNLQSDTIFLKNNKLIQELKEDNSNLQLKLTQTEKQKAKSDNNLKILAKEVRNQLKKNNEISAKYDKLLTNMNYLKEALGNFKILEGQI